jgi:hypothetical protein
LAIVEKSVCRDFKIDTIAVKSPFDHPGLEGTPILAFGGIEEEELITVSSPQAHFIERIPMLDKDIWRIS